MSNSAVFIRSATLAGHILMSKEQFWTLIAMILGSGVVFLDSTVVNLALPALSREFGATFADLQWIADGYLLSLSALILITGSLADIFWAQKDLHHRPYCVWRHVSSLRIGHKPAHADHHANSPRCLGSTHGAGRTRNN
jgi:MFS family permease